MKTDEPFPVIGTYRGVGLYAGQGPERLDVVRRDIDAVHAITEPVELADAAGDVTRAPESRLLAHAKCVASFAMATDARERRPAVDLERLHALVVGLDTLGDASRDYHCSIFDVWAPDAPPPARREQPLPERER